jgi:hypothetical protein
MQNRKVPSIIRDISEIDIRKLAMSFNLIIVSLNSYDKMIIPPKKSLLPLQLILFVDG